MTTDNFCFYLQKRLIQPKQEVNGTVILPPLVFPGKTEQYFFNVKKPFSKIKIVSCHTADSEPVKQEVNSTVKLPPLEFPAFSLYAIHTGYKS
jgi:hypothetical protein